ncbi:arylsulfatase K [Petromyzon marinus]|uniref:arylsulfatase K n=1 Tax=Petromyzon marinus TaxID=7757 RepID=UPI003F6EA2A7
MFTAAGAVATLALTLVLASRPAPSSSSSPSNSSSSSPSTPARPNIVLVVCDSMDGRLVTAPRPPVPLPWIERLAAAGAAFATAYTNSPVCCPSRAALWSGLHTHVTAAWNNHKCLPPGYPTWLDRLRAEAGYTTAVFGKTDFTSGGHSLSNRVEAWTRGVPGLLLRQEPRPRAELVGSERTRRVQLRDWNNTDRAVRWIRDVAPGRAPFALYLGLNLPHPYKTPSAGPDAGSSTFRTSPHWLHRVRRGAVVVPRWLPRDEAHPCDAYATFVKNCSGPFADDEVIAVRAAYYAMCAETDAMLGAVVRALGAAGFHLRGDTYVAFTCDHGELALEHRQYYKMSMYEGSARVPLVIAGPRVRPRRQRRGGDRGGRGGDRGDGSVAGGGGNDGDGGSGFSGGAGGSSGDRGGGDGSRGGGRGGRDDGESIDGGRGGARGCAGGQGAAGGGHGGAGVGGAGVGGAGVGGAGSRGGGEWTTRSVLEQTLVSLVDIYPTMMDIAGLPVDPRLNGTSLLKLLERRGRTARARKGGGDGVHDNDVGGVFHDGVGDRNFHAPQYHQQHRNNYHRHHRHHAAQNIITVGSEHAADGNHQRHQAQHHHRRPRRRQHHIHNTTNCNLQNDVDENDHDDEATSSAHRDLVKLSRGHRWALSQFHGSDLNESAYMLRVSRWKLVAYGEGPSSATRPQLFDLVSDPEELRDLSASRPHLTSRLEAALRSLMDYPAVTRAVRRYDRAAFLEWRAAAGPRYREAIAGLRWYRDWAEDPRGNLEAIDAWLERGE